MASLRNLPFVSPKRCRKGVVCKTLAIDNGILSAFVLTAIWRMVTMYISAKMTPQNGVPSWAAFWTYHKTIVGPYSHIC